MTEFELVSSGLRFPEGPIAMPDGSIIVVEIDGGALTRVLPGGSHEVISVLEGGPNGAALGPDGWVYVCNSGGWIYEEYAPGLKRTIGQRETPGWIERVHIETGAVERLYDRSGNQLLQSPNDLIFDSHGGFWFTDHGKHMGDTIKIRGVYYATADGSSLELVIPGLTTANGIGLSPDEKTLYVSETATRSVWAFDIIAPGQIKLRSWPPAANGGSLVVGLPGYNRLDSMAIDSAGNICVASLNNGGIWEISPDGMSQRHMPFPDHFTTNICFGGDDLCDAFVTLSASGRLVKIRWPRAGHPLAYLNR